MTERKTESYQLDKRTVKRAGFAGAIALSATVVAGLAFVNGAPRSVEANGTQSSPAASASMEATPRPSDAGATPTPEATQAPEARIETFHLNPGDKFEANVGDVVVGDVAMSDTEDATRAVFLFDTDTNKREGTDNTKTGLLVDVQAEGFVLSPYGGDVIRGLSGDKKSTWIELKKAEMINGGCVGGCVDGVDVVTWTGSETTVPQSGMKSEGSVVTTEPTATSTPEVGTDYSGLTNDERKQALLTLLADGKIDVSTPEGKALLDLLIQCICVGETVKPTPEPKPTATPDAECIPYNDHVMKAGETYRVPAGKDFIVQGDVIIDGRRTYDNSEKTGAISVVLDQKANRIKANWGADVQVFNDCATPEMVKEVYRDDLKELKATKRSLDKNSINQLK